MHNYAFLIEIVFKETQQNIDNRPFQEKSGTRVANRTPEILGACDGVWSNKPLETW